MTETVKRIHRPREERRIAGICAGIGHYFGVDPVLVRLVWVAGTFLTGIVPGVLAYAASWIIVPEEPVARAPDSVGQPHASPGVPHQ